MQRAKNPILKNLERSESFDNTNASTYLGISIKTGILLLVTILSGAGAWFMLMNGDDAAAITILTVTGIVSLISVLIASFIPRVAMPFSVLYSAAQGFALGALTYVVEALIPGGQGLSMVALLITVIVFGVMLALYSSRTLRATSRFRKVMMAGIISILVFSILGVLITPLREYISGNTTLTIVISILLVLYGAFMLVLNFDQAEVIVTHGLDKNYEWSASLGLMITIIWIYVEVLRLLVILFANRE